MDAFVSYVLSIGSSSDGNALNDLSGRCDGFVKSLKPSALVAAMSTLTAPASPITATENTAAFILLTAQLTHIASAGSAGYDAAMSASMRLLSAVGSGRVSAAQFEFAVGAATAVCEAAAANVLRDTNTDMPALAELTDALVSTVRYMSTIPRLSGVLTRAHVAATSSVIKCKTHDKVRANDPLLHVDRVAANMCAISALDVLRYYYNAGCILAALKRFDDAANAFTGALAIPTSNVSAIQASAYKKLLLCQLLMRAPVRAISTRNVSQIVSRELEQSASAYQTLQRALSQSSTRVADCLSENGETFRNERNGGLIKQISAKHSLSALTALSQTYSAMTLQQLKTFLKCPTDSALLSLLATAPAGSGIRIDERRQVVRFEQSAAARLDDFDGKATAALAAVNAVNEKLANKRATIVTSNHFVRNTLRNAATADTPPQHGAVV